MSKGVKERAEVWERLKKDVFAPAALIVEDVLKEVITANDVNLPKPANLVRIASRWFIDGTFKLVKSPFYQLFSNHALVKKGDDTKQVPLVYVLMSRRSKEDYVTVLSAMHQCLENPLVDWVMLDFEAGN
ncbi:hypothetical protein DPMN_083720 [Dreissena polymorpha]|uniref:MULE transposase domain-containing protein n=1 Tax=Dreissena polymorpha TaxID=45954 RepID=A0A9D3YD37_DREPO|nr:hypothetical protein DPMN_083720 [Dreissena polymorpha]